MLLDLLKLHCSMLNCDCACIATGEMCPLYDNETEHCLIGITPSEWNLDKLKSAFDKLATFDYGFEIDSP